MDEDLNLVGYRFNIIILVFFPTYMLFNPVATVIARKLGPRQFLSGITAAFGLVVVGFGLAKTWTTQVRCFVQIIPFGGLNMTLFRLVSWSPVVHGLIMHLETKTIYK